MYGTTWMWMTPMYKKVCGKKKT